MVKQALLRKLNKPSTFKYTAGIKMVIAFEKKVLEIIQYAFYYQSKHFHMIHFNLDCHLTVPMHCTKTHSLQAAVINSFEDENFVDQLFFRSHELGPE